MELCIASAHRGLLIPVKCRAVCRGATHWGESRHSENIHIGFFHSHGAEVAAALLQTLKSAAESSMPALILRSHSSYLENKFLYYLLTSCNNRFEVPNKNRPLNLLNRRLSSLGE